MAVTSGFYNSVSGDRKYNALQMSSIFDGIIEDGVYSTIGDHFSVTAGTGNTVIVGTGRAWFNHTWTLNDADYPVTLEPSEVVLNRYDAIVIEVNGSNAVRGNSIKVIKGTPGSSPSKPSLAKGDNNIWQHPLAYVYVPAGSSSISQSNIEYVVGKSECPFVVAAVQSVNIDALVAQWQDEFDTWFDNLEIQLSGDVAGNLQNQINQKVDKGNVIDNLEDLVANQANGMIAGAKAVAELNDNLDTNITTSESETHELYENQRIYTMYVDCKSLPNAGDKVYNLDIPSGFAWVDLSNSYAYSNVPRLGTIFPLNYHNEKTGSSITFSLNENDKTITFGTADDWSAYNAFIVIKYYKY